MKTERKMIRHHIKVWSNVGFALADLCAIPIGILVGMLIGWLFDITPLGAKMAAQMGEHAKTLIVGTLGALGGFMTAGVSAAIGCVVVCALAKVFDTDKTRICMGAHVPLVLLVGGLYELFWIGHCTDRLNRAQNEEHRVVNNEILLCLFVPFYRIWWFYEHAQRADWMVKCLGMEEDTLCGTWYMVCAILLPPVAAIMLQARLNKIDRAETMRARLVVYTSDVV